MMKLHIGFFSAKVSAIMLIAALFAACNDSFTGIIGSDYLPDAGSNVDTGDGIGAGIPINPYIVDPQYAVYNPQPVAGTRGEGAFGDWFETYDHWTNAQFYLYAFRAPNRTFYGDTDFTNQKHDLFYYPNAAANGYKDESNGALMKIQDMGSMCFYDFNSSDIENEYYRIQENHYFSQRNRDYRYNFYTFYADDATVDAPVFTPWRITRRVSDLDGTQDVVVGFAYHTEDELEQKLQELSKNGFNKTTGDCRVLYEDRQAMLYSGISAQYGLNPILHLRHLLSRFEIKVKGAYSRNNPLDALFKNVVITSIELQTPNGGTVTIADRNWKDGSLYEADYKAKKLFDVDMSTSDFRTIPSIRQERDDADETEYQKYVNWISQNVSPLTGSPDDWFHVNSDNSMTYSQQDYLVPVCDSYMLRVTSVHQKFRTRSNWLKFKIFK